MGAVLRGIALQGNDPVCITVSTGAFKSSGTDNDVMIRFVDASGKVSKSFKLDNTFRDDFEPGRIDKFVISDVGANMGKLTAIEIWREGFLDDDLFINVLVINRVKTAIEHVFPVHRWIPMKERLCIRELDCFLPEDDPDPARRLEELEWNRQVYELQVKVPGMPVQCATLPKEAVFSLDYEYDISARARKQFISSKMQLVKTPNWKKISDIKKLYTSKVLPLPQPAADDWHLKDECFGEQRLSGCNPMQIELCTTIPDNFAVTSDMVAPFLEGQTLKQVLDNKRLFLADYSVLKVIRTQSAKYKKTEQKKEMVAPLGLFYLSNKGALLPVAIQLHQDTSDTNPVFLPNDPPFTWMMAKMWFNLADGSVHQAKIHLGFTHLIVESICIVTHRQLSPSHPIFRLLAPHFLYLLAINHQGLKTLVSPGGWMDNIMNAGRFGVFDIIKESFKTWRMDVDGTLPEHIRSRGVTPDVLPHYPYRDDAMPIYHIIKDYVSMVVLGHYGESGEKLHRDHELQAWAAELSAPYSEGGVGIHGVPGGGKLETSAELIQILTSTIFMSSAQHAAVNFSQYDHYAFPAVYPGKLKGQPPRSKAPLSEADVIAALPNQAVTTRGMLITSILSLRGTNPLGDFEVQYAFDPIAKKALEKFRHDLRKARQEFLKRNAKRKYSYEVLDPATIPNSISI